MNAHAPDPALTEAQKIEEMLGALIDTIVERDIAPRTGRPERFTSLSIGDILDDFLKPRTAAERFAHRLERDPVREALCYAVTQLGERLFELGGIRLMSEALDRVAERDQRRWSHRTDIMDKRWDGIGNAETGALWCA